MKIGADPAIDLPTATQPSHWQQRDPSKIKSDHHLCLNGSVSLPNLSPKSWDTVSVPPSILTSHGLTSNFLFILLLLHHFFVFLSLLLLSFSTTKVWTRYMSFSFLYLCLAWCLAKGMLPKKLVQWMSLLNTIFFILSKKISSCKIRKLLSLCKWKHFSPEKVH